MICIVYEISHENKSKRHQPFEYVVIITVAACIRRGQELQSMVSQASEQAEFHQHCQNLLSLQLRQEGILISHR